MRKTHYKVDAQGNVCVVYIRKNACSALKRMILDSMDNVDTDLPPIKRMAAHMIRDEASLQRARVRSFILRDPLERVVSGWLNQVAQKLDRSYPEMFGGIEEAIGKPIRETTFLEFVNIYLGKARINGHFHSVLSHLTHVTYTHVLHDKTLFEDARHVFGAQSAKTYFYRPMNATAFIRTYDADQGPRVTAGEVFDTFSETRALPSKSSLMSEEVKEVLRARYKSDLALYDRYRQERGDAPPIPMTITKEMLASA